MNFKVLLSVLVTLHAVTAYLEWDTSKGAFDLDLYEKVIDPELCDQQVKYILKDPMLLFQFVDSGIRFPRGILLGNLYDFGNYHQCLGINVDAENTAIQGKYCTIQVPLNQTFEAPQLPEWPSEWIPEWPPEWPQINPASLKLDYKVIKKIEEFKKMNSRLHSLEELSDTDPRMTSENPLLGMSLNLAVCIPKPCTTEQALTSFLFNATAVGFQYSDSFCRLPDDKPWVPGDYVAIALISLLGLITLLSTSYDLYYTHISKKDPKKISVLGRAFSVYTNGRRLMTFNSNSESLECLDGIRALAMIWVILGHTISSVVFWANPLEGFSWFSTANALWLSAAHLTVDTFFLLSGILTVYSTSGKLSRSKLFKNIHLFYLNRLLRMFPILAAGVLLEATLFHRISDGPHWTIPEAHAHRCRTFWWSTLLHIQNYMNPKDVCIGQTWYLAIDVQLHILSPIILFWTLGRRKTAWIALTVALLSVLTSSTIYNFAKAFPAAITGSSDLMYYMTYYYINTLTRASPFIVGMMYGYVLHLGRGKKTQIPAALVTILWTCGVILMACAIYINYPIGQPGWSHKIFDGLYNSFVRPIWALAIGWLIVSCVNGYAGPINWFLSLRFWKLPARLSYAMYIFHYSLITIVNSSRVAPVYFSISGMLFQFLGHLTLTLIVSYVVVLILDSPFSVIFKLILGGGVKKRPQVDDKEVETQK